MFLDSTYFQGELALPNIKRTGVPFSSPLQTMQEESIEWFIARYEPEMLRRMLGKTLARNFVDGMQGETIEPRWQALYDVIYQEVDGFKFSPVANYVYYWIQRNAVSKSAMIGEVKPTADKAVNFTPKLKMLQAQNKMCEGVAEVWQFLDKNWETYKAYSDDSDCIDGNLCVPENKYDI